MINRDEDIQLKDILKGMTLDVLDDKVLADLNLEDTGLIFGPDQIYRLYAVGKLRVIVAKVENGYRINYVYEAQNSFVKGDK